MKFEKIKRLNELEINTDSNTGDLSEYFTLREEILTEFGLPNSYEFASILEFDSKHLTDFEIDNLLKLLHATAKRYLTENTITDIQLLTSAKDEGKSPFDVLPKLGVVTHVYTLFLYNQYLLKERESVESIIDLFRITNQAGVLYKLGTINKDDVDMIKNLEGLGLKYVQEFANKKR